MWGAQAWETLGGEVRGRSRGAVSLISGTLSLGKFLNTSVSTATILMMSDPKWVHVWTQEPTRVPSTALTARTPTLSQLTRMPHPPPRSHHGFKDSIQTSPQSI